MMPGAAQHLIWSQKPHFSFRGGFQMITFLGCVAGILLGLYFNVLVLLAICLIGSVTFTVISLSGLSFYTDLGDFLILLISTQAGYMMGLTGRDTYRDILARFHAAQSNRI